MRSSTRSRNYRGSVRSRSSASSVASSRDPKKKIRNCCRKLIAFMCTQVGVGGLIVGYAVVGAFYFISIEGQYVRPELEYVEGLHRNCADRLWDVVLEVNVFNETEWMLKADVVMKDFQTKLAEAVKRGYDGRTSEEAWSFPAALMFCLSIFTMIGYGNLVPRTKLGKASTVVYAVIGIPLYILYFMNMGQVLASVFKWFYRKMYKCSSKVFRDDPDPPRRIIVPSTACLWVLIGYILTGTIMFAEWEKWGYLDSTYFCVTSLCKIGMGDFVPGANILDTKRGHRTKLVINFVYLLIGMGLVAMCYNLMREVVKVKVQELKEDVAVCFEFLRLRAFASCNK